MSIAKALEAAARAQIRFFNREDTELQELRGRLWGDVEKQIQQLVDERIDQLLAPKKQKRG